MTLVIVLFVISAIVVASGLIYLAYFHKPSLASLNLRLLEIAIPQRERKENEDINSALNLSEQLFSSLSSLRMPFVFEAAVHHSGEQIHFYIAVPKRSLATAAHGVQALFPEARVEEISDYNVFSPTGSAVAGYLSLKENFILPIRTYEESKVDTFSQILSTMSKLRDVGEGAAVQILVHPAEEKTKKAIMGAIELLKKGVRLEDVLRATRFTGKDIADLFKKEKPYDEKNKIVDEEAVKTFQAKISKPLFAANIRIVASAEDQNRAEDILMNIAGAYAQFAAPLRNSVEVIRPRDQKKLLYNFSFREFELTQDFILNTAELASVFHLPVFSTEIPRIKWLSSKEAAPPQNLPQSGTILGESIFRSERKLVRQSPDDRRRHLYLIGQTGTGKSTLLQNMVEQDMKNGAGVCVIDPHGELVNDILGLVPKERIDDVIVFDPGDNERPLGLNMLEYDFGKPEQKTFIVNEMQSIFNRLFSQESMGPMFEQYMRNALLLLMEDSPNEPATLVEVSRIFTDSEFRARKLARIQNPTVIDFWQKEASKTSGDYSLANMAPYITSKFGNFVSNDYMRPIIGQPKSAFNFRDVMDTQKILLVNLSKGRIGDINANLLGMIITGRILMAALSRVDTEKDERKDFYFYIDEFQNFTTDSISTILSEARKYKLNLILAHQFIDQLEDEIRDSVFGNVGSLAAFRVGVPDTEILVKQFGPEFDEKDLISIENYNAFVKLLINGEPSRPFNMKTIKPDKGSAEVREKLKELSRLTYGTPNAEIERDILVRLRV